LSLFWGLLSDSTYGIEGSDAEDFINTLNGLLVILLIVLGVRDNPGLTGSSFLSELNSSCSPELVGLEEDTELPVTYSSSSLLFLPSRLPGDVDLETLGELQERRNVSETGRVFRSRRSGAELEDDKAGC
jgi:hypothetical protein